MTTLEQQFLGKKVLVICDSTFKKNERWVGICTKIGFNDLLGGKKQVTIDRTPLFLDNFNQVSLYVEPK